MTTQRLSSEKLFDIRLFKNLMRRRLPHILVAFLVNFFTICVPIMIWCGDYSDRLARGTYDTVRYISRAAEALQETMVINLVFIFILGIYFGIITLGYMMKRRSAHFYHALPQSRETLYTTGVASALVCSAIGGLCAIIIALIQLTAYSLLVWAVLEPFLILLTKNIVMFLAVYAITVFAGSFSGNGLVQALMSLVIMFYPLAAYSGIVLMRSIHTVYFWSDYYLSDTVLEWLSPVTYIGINYIGPIRIFPTIVALLAIAALMLGGMAIYRKRAIENSERPIVFKKLASVIKYMLMFVITVYVAIFFQAVGYSDFHMIFGIVCGAVISWMTFNTILAKSPKAMFKGVKGLLIFLLAFALFTAVVCYDITNYDEYVPAENNIKFADIEVSNVPYDDTRFSDPEMLAALSRLLKNQREENKKGFVAPISDNNSAFSVQAVIYSKLGIPVARAYRISKYTEGAEEFLRLYANDSRLEEAYSETKKALKNLAEWGYNADLHVNCNNYRGDLENPDFAAFAKTYLREFGTANYDRVSKPIVATVDINHITDGNNTYYSLYDLFNIDWPWVELAVYADMVDTIYLLGIEPEYTAPYTYYLDKEVEMEFASAVIYDTSEPQYHGVAHSGYSSGLAHYPYKEISSELANSLANLIAWYNESGYPNTRIFTAIDTDYILQLNYGDYPDGLVEDYYIYDEYGLKVSAAISSTEVQYYDTKYAGEYVSRTYFFPKGYVPESVKALFD